MEYESNRRGAARYLGDLVNRTERDPAKSLTYRALDVMRHFSEVPRDESNPEAGNFNPYDLYQRIIGGSLNAENETILGATEGNAALDNYFETPEPEYAKRFLLSSDLRSANPAVVEQYKNMMFEGQPGYTQRAGQPSPLMESKIYNPWATAFTYEAREAIVDAFKTHTSRETQEAATEFLSRPGAGFYSNLFSNTNRGKKDLRAVYFQAQNTDVVASLFKKGVSFEIATQSLDRKAFEQKNDVRISILAGNELLINTANLYNDQLDEDPWSMDRKVAYGMKYDGAFHPKIGYVIGVNNTDTEGPRRAELTTFIGTQNLTSATSRNSTIESILAINAFGSHGEKQLSAEIIAYTDTVLEMVRRNKDMGSYNDVTQGLKTGIASKLRSGTITVQSEGQMLNLEDVSDRSYLKFNQEIVSEYGKVIRDALNSAKGNYAGDRVVLSFKEITNLKGDPRGRQLTEDIIELARQGRIDIILDSKTYHNTISGTAQYGDKELLSQLTSYGAINLSTAKMHHDKTVAVFSDDKSNLKYLGIGSANLTQTSLGLSQNYTPNVEVIASIKSAEYGGDVFSEELLHNLVGTKGLSSGGKLFQHYDALLGGSFSGSQIGKGYMSDRPALLMSQEEKRISTINKLKTEINKYSQSGSVYGSKTGSIVAELRYAPESRKKFNYGDGKFNNEPVGLRINVTSPDKHHKLTFDVGVTAEGNIILSDLNKVMPGSLFVNKTQNQITLFDKADDSSGLIQKRVLDSGKSITLNPFETLLGFAETVQRGFVHQQEFGLVDASFRKMVARNRASAKKAIKSMVADVFAKLVPTHYSTATDGTPVRLKTILNHLVEKGGDYGSDIVKLALQSMANTTQTDTLTLQSPQERQALLRSAFDTIDPILMKTDNVPMPQVLASIVTGTSYGANDKLILDDIFAEQMINVLLEQDIGALNDIKKKVVMSDQDARLDYDAAARTQARTLLDDLSASFLSLHEETYSAYQGAERRSIFGRTENFEAAYGDSPLAKLFEAGILNPLPLGHSSKVAAPGTLYRSLGATATGADLMLPIYGGLKNLRVSDSDLSTGAAVGQDVVSMMRSTPGFASIEEETYSQEIQTLLNALPASERDAVQAEAQQFQAQLFGTQSRYIYTPFDKLDQMTQRIKNVVGMRPALELSDRFASAVLKSFGLNDDNEIYKYFGIDPDTDASLDSFKDYGITAMDDPRAQGQESVLAGSLRNVLPQAQFEEVKQVIKDLKDAGIEPTFENVQDYFRRKALRQPEIKHGFIGGTKYRRLAMNLGTSMFGDFNYLNPGYQYIDEQGERRSQVYGKQHSVRLKVSPTRLDQDSNEVEDMLGTQAKINEMFGSGAIASTMEFKVGDVTYQPGLYRKDPEGKLVQIGDFDDSGFVALRGINTVTQTSYGKRIEPIQIKIPAWSKRTEGGITYINPNISLSQTSRQTLIYELDTYTIYRPGTGSRWVGGGLSKGPVVYLEDSLFDNLESIFDERQKQSPTSLMPSQIAQDKLYGMTSMGTFKGVNYETGMYLLSQADSFDKLVAQGKANDNLIVQSLALMFLKDKEIKSALSKSLISSGNYSMGMAIEMMKKGVDITNMGVDADSTEFKDKVSNPAIVASGLTYLGGAESIATGDLTEIKSLLKQSLAGDSKATEALTNRARELMAMARDGGISLGSQTIINDQSGISKGAGIIAHLMYFGEQFFNPALGKVGPQSSVGGLYEAPLNNIDLYSGKVSSVEGFDTESYRTYVNLVLRSLGPQYQLKSLDNVTEEEYKENLAYNSYIMNLAESRLRNAFVVETIVDNQISQSLVASGMSDSVKTEYQYYVGMTNQKLDRYRKVGGEAAGSVMEAYMIATGALNNNMLSLSREQTLGLNIAIPTSTNQEGLLSTQATDLRTLAAMYNSRLGSMAVTDADGNRVNLFEAGIAGSVTAQNYGTDSEKVRAINKGIIQQAFETSQKAALDANDLSVASKDYVEGLRTSEVFLIKEKKRLADELQKTTDLQQKSTIRTQYEQVSKALAQITESTRIVLPNIEYVSAGDGRFRAAMRYAEETDPTVGLLLGTDFLTSLSMSFGDFESAIIKEQMKMVDLLEKAQPILAKFNQPEGGIFLNEEEINIITELRTAIDQSKASVFELVTSDVARQALGDHQSMRGAVGIAVNSFLLRPDEALLGERYARIASESISRGSKAPNLDIAVQSAVRLLLNTSDPGKAKQHATNLAQLTKTYAADSTVEMSIDSLTEKYFKLSRSLAKDKKASRFQHLIHSALYDADINYRPPVDGQIPNISSSEQRLIMEAALYKDMLGMGDLSRSTDEGTRLILAEILKDRYDQNVDWEDQRKTRGKIKRENTLQRIAAMGAGFMLARTGQPAASSALDNELNDFRPLHLLKYQKRYQELSAMAQDSLDTGTAESGTYGLFRLDQQRMSTGLFVPSNSRLISGLGDYDGDSYRLILDRLGERFGTTEDGKGIDKVYERLNQLTFQKNKLEKDLRYLKSQQRRSASLHKTFDDVVLDSMSLFSKRSSRPIRITTSEPEARNPSLNVVGDRIVFETGSYSTKTLTDLGSDKANTAFAYALVEYLRETKMNRRALYTAIQKYNVGADKKIAELTPKQRTAFIKEILSKLSAKERKQIERGLISKGFTVKLKPGSDGSANFALLDSSLYSEFAIIPDFKAMAVLQTKRSVQSELVKLSVFAKQSMYKINPDVVTVLSQQDVARDAAVTVAQNIVSSVNKTAINKYIVGAKVSGEVKTRTLGTALKAAQKVTSKKLGRAKLKPINRTDYISMRDEIEKSFIDQDSLFRQNADLFDTYDRLIANQRSLIDEGTRSLLDITPTPKLPTEGDRESVFGSRNFLEAFMSSTTQLTETIAKTDYASLSSNQLKAVLELQTKLYKQQSILAESIIAASRGKGPGVKEFRTLKDYVVNQSLNQLELISQGARELIQRADLEDLYNRPMSYVESRLEEVSEELAAITSEEQSLEEQVQLSIGQLTKHQELVDRVQSKQLKDLRRFIRSFTNLPTYATEQVGTTLDELQMGEMIANISQKFDMGNIEDGAGYTSAHMQNIQLLGMIADSEQFQEAQRQGKTWKEMLNIEDESLMRKYAEYLVSSSDGQKLIKKLGLAESGDPEPLLNRIRSGLGLIRDRLDGSPTDESGMKRFKQLLMDGLSQVTSKSQGLDVFTKKVVGRVGATLLNPFEFDVALQAIGEGGTTLIGTAYNTLIPLLDTLMIEQAFSYSETSGMLSKAMAEFDPSLATALGVVDSTGSPEQKASAREAKLNIRRRMGGVISVMANFQQIVRDALKAKEDSNLLKAAEDIQDVQGRRLIEILASDYEGIDPKEADAVRKESVTRFLFESLGPQIVNNRFYQSTTLGSAKPSLLSAEGTSTTITGFGALMMLSDYAKTKDSAEVFNKFIADESGQYGDLRAAFESWVEQKVGMPTSEMDSDYKGGLANEFISNTIVDLLQRTQASFAVSSMGSQVSEVATRFLGLMEGLNLREGETIDTLSRDEIASRLGIDLNEESIYDSFDLYDAHMEKQDVIDNLIRDYDLFSDYQQAIEIGADDGAVRERLVSELILRGIQERDERYKILTPDSLDYLRMAAIDRAELNQSTDATGMSAADKIKMGSTVVYNQLISNIRSGKLTDASTIIEASQFRLSTMLSLLSDQGIDLSVSDFTGMDPNEVQKLIESRVLLGGLTSATGLDEEKSNKLLEFMLTTHEVGPDKSHTGLALLAQQSAALATYEKLIERRRKAVDLGETTLVDYIDDKLAAYGTGADQIIDLDSIQNISGGNIDEKIYQAAEENMINLIQQGKDDIITQQTTERRARMRSMRGAEIAGIVASPLLFAMGASGEIEMDERVGLMMLDVMQGVAELANRPSTTVAQFMTDDMQSSQSAFQFMRMRQAIGAEGAIVGGLAAISQELLYKGIGQVSDMAVSSVLGGAVRRNPNIGNVGAAVAGEVISSVLSAGVARSLSGVKAFRGAKRFNNPMARMSVQISEAVWRAVEDAQLALVQADSDVEVNMVEYNEQMDFETSGIPSDIELDIITGIIVLDGDDNVVNDTFEDDNSMSYSESVWTSAT